MSDTSMVFNLVARDRVSATLGKVREKFDQAAAGIGAGVAAGLATGVMASLDMSAANAKLAAQLGIGPEKAAQLSKVSADVYAQAWGDSSATVNEAIKGVYQNIGDTSKAKGGLEGLTSKALALAETFDQEVGPTTAAVGQMLKTGLAANADEAFDILTKGFQTGANKADDLLDTVNEYGTQWRKFGLDGKTAMGLLSQGLKGGARDADLVADSIKEFSIRAIDGSKTTAQGFKSIGLDAGTMAARIAKGGKSASGALDLTLDKLRGIKDPVKRSATAVQLFGTQAEDLGDALYSLDPSKAVSALGQVGGAADKTMKTLGDSPAKTLEKFKRTAVTKLAEVSGGFIKFAMDNKTVMEPLAYTLGGIAAAIIAVKLATIGYNVVTAVNTGLTAANTAALEGNGLALIVYGARMAAVRTGTALWAAAQWLLNAAFWSSPVTWIVIGIIALVAIIILIATKTTWFQTIWKAVWGGIKSFMGGVVDGIKTGIAWFGSLPGKFSGWFNAAKAAAVKKMSDLVTWLRALPGRTAGALGSLVSTLRSKASSAFGAFREAAVAKASSFIAWVRGIPGRIARGIGSLSGLLVGKGKDVIRGLWNGIKSMGSWLKGVLIGFAKNLIPGPIAKALGIASPSRLLADEIGHWIPPGIAMGAEENRGVLDKTMQGLVDPQAAAPTAPLTSGMAPLMGAQAGGGQVTVRFEMGGADNEFKRLMRKIVRVDGRGNVQVAFGQTK